MLQVLRDLNILTTIKYYDELLRKVKTDQNMVAQNMTKAKKTLNAMIAVRTLYARCVRAVSAP